VSSAVDDYPRTLVEFEARFATDEACRAYLERLRWPNGFRCPKCGGATAWRVRMLLWQCATCGRQTSVTAGTVFQDSRTPLTTGFRAMWCVTSTKTGTSALALQGQLGLGSYQTAWTWLHKLRRAMVRPGRDRLSGQVEVDESFVGGVGGAQGRSTATKALIVVAAEERGRGIGRIRMRRVPNASAASLGAFVDEAIEPGSEIHTDGWHGYDRLKTSGYLHRVTYLRGDADLAMEQLPRVHRVISLLKRWLLGTHQGAVSVAHLDYYLDEFTFRFNRRRARHRGLLFCRLAQQAVAVSPAPYARIIRPPQPCTAPPSLSPAPQPVGVT
jgi:transposase-like protein/ribosomal protein L37AE/L43A